MLESGYILLDDGGLVTANRSIRHVHRDCDETQ